MMLFIPALIGLFVALATVPLSIMLSRRFGMFDIANARKVHREPTPRLGGIAIVASVVCGLVGTAIYRFLVGIPVESQTLQSLAAICVAGFFIFMVGLVDDLRSISSRFKLAALIGAAAMVCGSGVLLSEINAGGRTLVGFSYLSWPLTIVWIIGVAVAINFIDGLDGLAGGLTLLSAAVLTVFSLTSGTPDISILSMALCGSLIGFLCFNWHPAKTFMGDCGSLTIGFWLASSIALANPVVGTMRGVVLPTFAICIPIADSLLTLFRRRYLQRRSMFSAERGHVHHRLLDRGLTHLQTVLTIYSVSVLAVVIGLVSLSFTGWATLGGLALLIPLLWGTFQLAGSVRTNEMLTAMRAKHEIDRTTKHYRTTFEDMQLEFHHVETFSQWWEGVCRTAERLDFVRVTLRIPSAADRDGEEQRNREMVWETDNVRLTLCERMRGSIPIVMADRGGPTATATVDIAATKSLESAGERLALFARLMTEHSIAAQRKRERQADRRQRANRGSLLAGAAATTADDFTSESYGPFAHLRVAIVHDFLYTYCGAERVLEQLIHVVPHCDVFALFDFLPESQRAFLQGKPVTTSFIQHLPFASTKHRAYLPLMPLAIEQLDVSGYDLVISSSYLAAKGVITGPDQLHVCYCHSPVRFAWDLHHQYMNSAGLGYGPKGLLARTILHYIRSWDVRSSLGVDHFISNSHFISRRIKKVYRRNATVIHPPVDTHRFDINTGAREDFYLVSGRMVPYKRTEMIVEAFRQMPDRQLVVIGEGPDFEKVKLVAGENVTLLGFQQSEVLVDHMRRAKALIIAAEEDFGIVPVESLACGTPVIAFGRGGATETVVDGEHGVFFDEQTTNSLVEAIGRFESQLEFGKFSPVACRNRSELFSHQRFSDEIISAIRRWTAAKWDGDNQSSPDNRARHFAGDPNRGLADEDNELQRSR